MIAADSDLEAVVNWAESDHDAGALKLAARLEDQAGAILHLAVYANTSGGDDVVVVRHCDNGDCVSAVQTILDTGRRVAVEHASGRHSAAQSGRTIPAAGGWTKPTRTVPSKGAAVAD